MILSLKWRVIKIVKSTLSFVILLLQVSIFTREDIDTMFSTFDLTNRGYVTQLQYRKGKPMDCLILAYFTDNFASYCSSTCRWS